MIESAKLTISLWLLICVSAVAVVYSNHGARSSFIEWQTLLQDAQDFDVEWGQLLIEKSSLSSYARLEGEASKKLNMSAPTTEQIVIVNGGEK